MWSSDQETLISSMPCLSNPARLGPNCSLRDHTHESTHFPMTHVCGTGMAMRWGGGGLYWMLTLPVLTRSCRSWSMDPPWTGGL